MSAPTSPPPPRWPDEPPHSPPRRLTRLTDQGKVAGVAAGIGWYFGIDPVLVRIGLVVLTIATGAGIPAYIIAWVVLPEARSTDTAMPPPPRQRDGRSLLVLGLAITAAVILLGQIDVFSGQVLTAAVLIGIGVLLFSDGDRLRTSTPPPIASAPPGTAPPPPPPPPPPATAHPSGAPPVVDPPPLRHPQPERPYDAPPHATPRAPAAPPGARQSAYGPYAGAWPDADSHGAHPARPERLRSVLGLLGFGGWLATMGTAVLLDRLGVVHLTPVAGVGLTLAVIGGTLLVGTLFGRARGLIGFGIAAALVLVPLSALGTSGVDLSGGFGERVHAPTSVEAIHDYQIVAGAQALDLTGLELDGRSVTVTASMVAGELQVQVPEDVTVVVSGSLTAGERTLFGETLGGTDLPMDATHDGVEGRGRIELDLSVIFGEVIVETVPVPATTGPR